MIVGEWLSNLHGDIGRVSIQFFHGIVLIDVCKLSQDNGQICHGSSVRFSLKVKNLPTFAHAIDRAVSFAYDRGLISAAYDYGVAESKKEGTTERSSP